MSGIDSLHITTPELDNNAPFSPYSIGHKRNSISSTRSGASTISPYEPPVDFLSPNEDHTERKSSKKGVSSFISKLHAMVEDGRHQNLISWNPNGTSFFVYNAPMFAQEVLPEYFKHSNFSSFVRLLNMYGFHKINKSPRGQRGHNENEIWEFSHPKFQHGRPEHLKNIKRKAMDSELLRRETGDIQASFASLQMSQADLLRQFHILQESFSNILQSFEETKKVQQQQEMMIRQLAERQGLSPDELFKVGLQDASLNTQQKSTIQSPPVAVLVTPDQKSYNPMQFVNDHQTWDSQPPPDPTMALYDSVHSPTLSPLSSQLLDIAVNTPLPPSPIPILGSPIVSLPNGNQDGGFQFDDVNTLGLGFT